jgi:hypothetical protein
MEENEVDKFMYVLDYVCKNLEETGQKIPRKNITFALLEVNDKFDKGVEHMYNFITWMNEHGYSEHEIFPTLVHDLNGRNDTCFLPRTSTY